MDDFDTFRKTACVILSGGFSKRMNTHKALLGYDASESFLQHLITVYKEIGIKTIIVVVNSDIRVDEIENCSSDVLFIKNEMPEIGRLYSLQLGLRQLFDMDYCFIQNVDSPFVNHVLITNLHKKRTEADYITPVYDSKGGHPILISGGVVETILKENNYDVSLKDLLVGFTRYKVATDDECCLVNINTPEEYEKWFKNRC